jgi:hypothetical protein
MQNHTPYNAALQFMDTVLRSNPDPATKDRLLNECMQFIFRFRQTMSYEEYMVLADLISAAMSN